MLSSFLFIGFLITLLASVYFYFELKNTKEKYTKEHKANEHKLFELQLLSDISDKIGYSLSIKDIASTIAMTSEKIFRVSTVSYAIIEQDHIEITTIAHENVGTFYVSGVRDIMLAGIYGVDDELKRLSISQKVTGRQEENTASDIMPASYFNIPLVLNNRFTGIISITSKEKQAYQEEDMSMLYKIVNKASVAMGRLEDVIETEKGKIDSLVKSLSSGEMFFTLEFDSLHLFTINNAALRFLNITESNPDLIHVLSKFKLKPNIIAEMKEVILMKKSTIYRNVEVYESRFNIYLTPVFALDNSKVIGVALTMQDVTREHETQKMREGFTNMMVHELRAPLTAIKGAADLLLKPGTEEEDRVKMRLVIKSASERLLKDIDDMLDTAKIDAGKMAIQKSESDINDVIQKACEELSYTAQDR
ncbi:MAG: sensor histidine kinase, partial [Candidatus Roizmanbacteria bacterium]